MHKFKVNEIFITVSGEVGMARQGSWIIFVRFDLCNLRCSWCDTEHTQEGDQHTIMTLEEIMHKVNGFAMTGCRQIMITGGEPLMQPRNGLRELIGEMKENGYHVSMETGGSLKLHPLDLVDCFIVDYKLPTSGEEKAMFDWEWYHNLPPNAWVKFVIGSLEDYTVAKMVIKHPAATLENAMPTLWAMSPCPGLVEPAELFNWMRIDQLIHVHFNLQIHKAGKLNE